MSIIKASQSPYSSFDVISTGLSAINQITGIEGLPSRKIVEISGQYSVGKSTLSLMILAEAQRVKKPTLLADAEISFSTEYAQKFGINPDKLDLIQERFAETILDLIEEWAEKYKNGVIVIDSIGSLLPRAEAEKGAEGRVIGGQAKIIATFCRKIVPILAINNHLLVALNHQFTDLMSGKLKTSGGQKLEYSKSLHIMLRKMPKRVMRGENQIGDVIEAEVRKNKLAGTLHQKAELILLYNKGFSEAANKLDSMIESGEITKKGNTFWHGEIKVGVGENRAREYVDKLKEKAA